MRLLTRLRNAVERMDAAYRDAQEWDSGPLIKVGYWYDWQWLGRLIDWSLDTIEQFEDPMHWRIKHEAGARWVAPRKSTTDYVAAMGFKTLEQLTLEEEQRWADMERAVEFVNSGKVNEGCGFLDTIPPIASLPKPTLTQEMIEAQRRDTKNSSICNQ